MIIVESEKPPIEQNILSIFYTQHNCRAISCKFRIYSSLFSDSQLFREPLVRPQRPPLHCEDQSVKGCSHHRCVCTGESLWVLARACQGMGLSGSAVRLIYWRMPDSPVGLSGISQRLHGGFCWRLNVRMVFLCVSVFLEGMVRAKASDPPSVQRLKCC